MITRLGKLILVILMASLSSLTPLGVGAREPEVPTPQTAPSQNPSGKLVLGKAVMCEKVENLVPIQTAIVFSASVGQVCCYTSFDSVPETTTIYHKWYHYDELSTQIRLKLYPPKWTTYSVIQLRETDKGPWYVEVTDQNGKVLDLLRFSITD